MAGNEWVILLIVAAVAAAVLYGLYRLIVAAVRRGTREGRS